MARYGRKLDDEDLRRIDLMRSQGISQETCARAMKVSQNTIHYHEHNGVRAKHLRALRNTS